MTSKMDIYRSANYLIKEHGDQAAIFAAMQADYLLERGDVDGQRTWLRILKAIEELSSTERGDATLH
jgi:hypothetical protein